jgi:hypothetical protein
VSQSQQLGHQSMLKNKVQNLINKTKIQRTTEYAKYIQSKTQYLGRPINHLEHYFWPSNEQNTG